ncbi:hypothetical protein K437DRAFT_276956 [Tilletiaria anomala UBC 951]|uniref:NADH-ubiquinone oxidoreductase MLRQ subunit n=1 Tax=Tilletiaria anomala (strain ATCC 24038 / CBS 436.72 / UBC 951) TaxID=1037660 RepID=A0A066V2I9_TILAU|nr:uncharacterized protein K437DRAFT_276956 [Tilletiaria anomala UBC 951]KDN35676.1 hypothetical protein K437DRAFT_276956 [Tilletiaria anomala UBC 951]
MAQNIKNAAKGAWMKNWYSPEVVPIYVITAAAAGGATWYLTRLARGPDVIWDRKNNPTPWNNVEPGTNTKLMAVNHEFERTYKRDRL